MVGFRGARSQIQVQDMNLPTPQYTDYSGIGEGFSRGFSGAITSGIARKQTLEDEARRRQQALDDEARRRNQAIADEAMQYQTGLTRAAAEEARQRPGLEEAAYPKETVTANALPPGIPGLPATATYRMEGSGFREGLPLSFLQKKIESDIQPIRPEITPNIMYKGKPSIRTLFPGKKTAPTYEDQYIPPDKSADGKSAESVKERAQKILQGYVNNIRSNRPVTTEQMLTFQEFVLKPLRESASSQTQRLKDALGALPKGTITEEERYQGGLTQWYKNFGIDRSTFEKKRPADGKQIKEQESRDLPDPTNDPNHPYWDEFWEIGQIN